MTSHVGLVRSTLLGVACYSGRARGGARVPTPVLNCCHRSPGLAKTVLPAHAALDSRHMAVVIPKERHTHVPTTTAAVDDDESLAHMYS